MRSSSAVKEEVGETIHESLDNDSLGGITFDMHDVYDTRKMQGGGSTNDRSSWFRGVFPFRQSAAKSEDAEISSESTAF